MKTQIYWIAGSWPGRLAIVPRPRGEDWLADEIRGWRAAGLDAVVSLLTTDEEAEFSLSDESELCRKNGIDFTSFPIEDRDVHVSLVATTRLILQLEKYLAHGTNVGLHCRQSVGRSGLIAACLLVAAGLDDAAACKTVSEARGVTVPETPEQRAWIAAFAANLVTLGPERG